MSRNKGKKRTGLQKKIFRLCGLSLLIMSVFCVVLTLIRSEKLRTTLSEINTRQKEISGKATTEFMDNQAYNTLAASTYENSYIADNIFDEYGSIVCILRDQLAEMFEYDDKVQESRWIQRPDKKNEGKVTPQLIYTDKMTDPEDPALLEDLAILSNMQGSLKSVVNNNASNIGSTYIATPTGIFFVVDKHSANKFNDDGSIKILNTPERPWYQNTIDARKLCFSDIEADIFSGNLEVMCTVPVYVKGELRAIVGIDIFVDEMAAAFENQVDDEGLTCIIDDKGKVLFSTQKEGTFEPSISGDGLDIRESDNKELADFVNSAYSQYADPKKITVDGETQIFAAAPMPCVGWVYMSSIRESILRAPGLSMEQMLDEISDEELKEFNSEETKRLILSLVGMIIILLVVMIVAINVASRVTRPLVFMNEQVRGLSGSDLSFTMSDRLRTGDEIETLAESFADLSSRIQTYIDENNQITAEKERIGTELSLATNIQCSMLPSVFPAFPERKEFDIYATMDPAKEVGGDFYDFFFIDHEHLALVIADVSGKGVPAALFMMMSKMLINNYTILVDDSPARILELVNEQVSKHNKAKMFVTVWLGIINIYTGVINCANAGHEFPAIRKNGKYELFEDPHGFVIGGLPGMKYTEYEIKLEPGDALFVYTDGVTEATDSGEELYGTDRMLEALNENAELPPDQLLVKMRKAVDDFVKEAPQFDDITMLGLTYLGPAD